jgi:MFS family permease
MKMACFGFSETFSYAALCSFIPALAIALKMSEMELALFFTAEAIVFTITNVIVGMASDKIGRKPIMIVGLVSSSLNLSHSFSRVIFGKYYL